MFEEARAMRVWSIHRGEGGEESANRRTPRDAARAMIPNPTVATGIPMSSESGVENSSCSAESRGSTVSPDAEPEGEPEGGGTKRGGSFLRPVEVEAVRIPTERSWHITAAYHPTPARTASVSATVNCRAMVVRIGGFTRRVAHSQRSS